MILRFAAVIALLAALVVDVSADQLEPPRIIRTTPVFVPEVAQAEVQEAEAQEVEVVINVDAEGQLVDLLVTRAASDAHARAAERALREWRYEPGRQDGRPVGVRQSVIFSFERDGPAFSTGGFSMAIHGLRLPRDGSRGRLSSGHDLDAPLEVLESVAPQPIAVGDEPERVVLDFIVDTEGRPRMPAVLPGASELHAISAVSALEQWRFRPPTRKGRPVLVHVQQEFRFKPKSS